MQRNIQTAARAGRIIEVNSVIRNTYILLSMSLIFSAIAAFFAVITNAPHMGTGLVLIGYFGLIFLINTLRNSAWGVLAVFAFTGFLGYTLGPMLNAMLHTYVNGAQIIAAALGLTGAIFFGLSGYAMVSRKDFSYLGGFLFSGVTIAFVASLLAIFFNIPSLQLAVSSGFVLLASGLILYETSQIINGGERNYIMATISLYVQIYNLFISLLHILSVFSGRHE